MSTPTIAVLVAAFVAATLWAVFLMWYRCNERDIRFEHLPGYSWLFAVPGVLAVAVAAGWMAMAEGPSFFGYTVTKLGPGLVIGFVFGLVWDVCAFQFLNKLIIGFEGMTKLTDDWYPKMRSFVTGSFIFDWYFGQLGRREGAARLKFVDDFVEEFKSLSVAELAKALREVAQSDLNDATGDKAHALADELEKRFPPLIFASTTTAEDRKKARSEAVRGFTGALVNSVDRDARTSFLQRARHARKEHGQLTPMPAPADKDKRDPPTLRVEADLLLQCKRVVLLSAEELPDAPDPTLPQPHAYLRDGFSQALVNACMSSDAVVFLDDGLISPQRDGTWSSPLQETSFLHFLANRLSGGRPLVVIGLRQPRARLAGFIRRPWTLLECEDAAAAARYVASLKLVPRLDPAPVEE